MKLFRLAASIPWAMTPEMLSTILAIANREGPGPAAVSAQLGRPLENSQKVEMRDGVAVITLDGPIFPKANAFTEISGATSVSIAARDFYTALNDPNVSAILLNINSPGGDVTGINEFADMVASARGVKPVHAYVGGLGASAAYWIASAAEKIIIDATARVGSIGVVMAMPNPDAEKAEEIEIVSSQSPNKRPNVATEEGRATIQDTVDALADVFVSTVAKNRGVTSARVVSDFGRGGILVGKAAVAAGMADKIGSYESALKGLRTAARSRPGKSKMSADHEIKFNVSLEGVDEAAAQIDALAPEVPEALAAVIGETSAIKAVGKVETQFAAAARVPELEAKVAELQGKLDAQEHAALVAQLRNDGKFTSAMAKMAAKMPLAALRDFAADAEPIPALVAAKVEEPKAPSIIAITSDGKAFCQLTLDDRHNLILADRERHDAMKREHDPATCAACAKS